MHRHRTPVDEHGMGTATPAMMLWECVQVEPKDADGMGVVKLAVIVTTGGTHNVITDVRPEGILVTVGAVHKEGRAQLELSGFFRELLEVRADQLKIEGGSNKKTKVLALTIVLSSLTQDKRSMLWFLQAKAGQKHEAHFASDHFNAIRAAENPNAKKRKAELDEFQQALEEASSAAAAEVLPLGALGTSAAAPRGLPSLLKVKRDGKTIGGDKQVAASGDSNGVAAVAKELQHSTEPKTITPSDPVSAAISDSAGLGSGGLGGLAGYESEEPSSSEDEDE